MEYLDLQSVIELTLHNEDLKVPEEIKTCLDEMIGDNINPFIKPK